MLVAAVMILRGVELASVMADDAVGWDPIFEYEGKTYAEMDKVEKVWLSLPADYPPCNCSVENGSY